MTDTSTPTQLTPSITDPTATTTAMNTAVTNAAPTFASIPQINIPTTGDMATYYQQAFQQLQPYYQQKLAEANGDLTEAMRKITYDYTTGVRYNTQDTALSNERDTQDFTQAMNTLGLTIKGEQNKEMDTLNQRGIGLIQDPNGGAHAVQGSQTQYDANGVPVSGSAMTYDANGNPTYTGSEGEAGNELSSLQEDERLRQEAQTRTSQRALQDVGIKYTRQNEALGETQQEDTYTANRTAQEAGETLGEQEQSQAYQLASDKENQNITQQQITNQQNQVQAQEKAAQQDV